MRIGPLLGRRMEPVTTSIAPPTQAVDVVSDVDGMQPRPLVPPLSSLPLPQPPTPLTSLGSGFQSGGSAATATTGPNPPLTDRRDEGGSRLDVPSFKLPQSPPSLSIPSSPRPSLPSLSVPEAASVPTPADLLPRPPTLSTVPPYSVAAPPPMALREHPKPTTERPSPSPPFTLQRGLSFSEI